MNDSADDPRVKESSAAIARRVFRLEAQAVAALGDRVGSEFDDAVRRLLESEGRVIVCGIGKSGLIGRKISATLASTGTPSFFMHPGDAFHGDLGMVTPSDSFIAISYSGETEEILRLVPFLRDNENLVVAITGNEFSTLANFADCILKVSVEAEACPLQLAPTTSTTACLAMGDALAVALMAARGFQAEQFARFHPGGSLGRMLLKRVEHEMVTGNLPCVSESAGVFEIMKAISDSTLGLTTVRTATGWALITDGDLRRGVERFGQAVFDCRAADLMTRHPVTITVGTRTVDALAKMERNKINALLVFDGDRLVGILKK